MSSASDVFNERRIVGTDSASWFLFHPDDLAHRSKDPIGWHMYDFAIQKEFVAGNLIAVSTGGDGGFSIRFTNGKLSSLCSQFISSPLLRVGDEMNCCSS